VEAAIEERDLVSAERGAILVFPELQGRSYGIMGPDRLMGAGSGEKS
jgi:hypothetical protein